MMLAFFDQNNYISSVSTCDEVVKIWKIEDNLLDLIYLIKKILSKKALFLVLTSYAIRSSHTSLYYLLKSGLKIENGVYSSGELGIKENNPKGRVLSCANFARWQK